MIKFETNNGKSTIEMVGNTQTMFADLCSFVETFHKAIKEDSKDVADFFEWFVRNELGHVVFDRPDEEDKEDGKKAEKTERKEEEDGDIADDIKELIGNLEELVKLMKK